MNAEYIKAKAKELGATVCGIGNVELLAMSPLREILFSFERPPINGYSILSNYTS